MRPAGSFTELQVLVGLHLTLCLASDRDSQQTLTLGKTRKNEDGTGTIARPEAIFRRLELVKAGASHLPRRRLLASEEEDSSGPRKALITEPGAYASGSSELASEGVTLGLLKKKKGMLDAFLSSFSMILVTEIGDETFIIAALMAMRHSRAVVLAGALMALAVMTVLSTALGMIVPNLISKEATNKAAAVLYTFFGLRLLYIAWRADPKDTPQKEMEEVEEKLEEDQNGKGHLRGLRKILAGCCSPVFLEAFILTFLAEWGDRSQIATISLAAHKDAIGVTVGAILGHCICTGLAVMGGRLLALKISQRTVAMVGGLLFLVFAAHSFFSPVTEY